MGADVAIVVVGVTSSEGTDRKSLSLPSDQLAYLHAAVAAQSNTIVIVMTPGSLMMDWADKVPGILCSFLPGQGQGAAVANVLYGDVNPSGRLPVTMPVKENPLEFSEEQYPGIAFSDGLQTNYSEKLEVGYRWYLAHKAQPAFIFGSGLSYTSFKYSDVRVLGQGGAHSVEMTLHNVGKRRGAEVAQLYLQFPASAGEPPLQLKGFEKVSLDAGASTKVTFKLRSLDLSVWDEEMHKWAEQKGEFGVAVGSSLSDIRLRTTFKNGGSNPLYV